MAEVTIPDDLLERYERLASDLTGFEDADELLEYVLTETASELERTDGVTGNDVDEDAVDQRLRDLGYVE